jgi:heme oxygenase
VTAVDQRTAVGSLRQRTRDLHARAEAAFPLARPDLDRATYARTLRGLLGVHDPLEAAIDRVLGPEERVALDWPARSRAALLRADLAGLGAPAAAPGVAAELSSVAAAVGALYVLEGSLLGAEVIGPAVRSRLGADVPCRYLTASGSRTAQRWAAFRRAADRLVGPGDVDEAVAAARATFTAIEEAVA